jgi:hypothetical protein
MVCMNHGKVCRFSSGHALASATRLYNSSALNEEAYQEPSMSLLASSTAERNWN